MIDIKLFSISGTLWHISGQSVSAPGTLGRMQIFKNHLPLCTMLNNGKVYINNITSFCVYEIDKSTIIQKPKHFHFFISQGYIKYENNTMMILGDIVI
jgi:F0F1-type ATP synthase epsilon subunit